MTKSCVYKWFLVVVYFPGKKPILYFTTKYAFISQAIKKICKMRLSPFLKTFIMVVSFRNNLRMFFSPNIALKKVLTDSIIYFWFTLLVNIQKKRISIKTLLCMKELLFHNQSLKSAYFSILYMQYIHFQVNHILLILIFCVLAWFGLVSLFNDISTFMCYLMP